jgi:hypothetical protein
MRLPWISRAAYDDARADNARLWTMLERALDHNARLDRKALGLPESPPAPRAPVVLSPAIQEAAPSGEQERVRCGGRRSSCCGQGRPKPSCLTNWRETSHEG